eukprot:10285325-Lingulodinium_polyedra.AAC.1
MTSCAVGDRLPFDYTGGSPTPPSPSSTSSAPSLFSACPGTPACADDSPQPSAGAPFSGSGT